MPRPDLEVAATQGILRDDIAQVTGESVAFLYHRAAQGEAMSVFAYLAARPVCLQAKSGVCSPARASAIPVFLVQTRGRSDLIEQSQNLRANWIWITNVQGYTR